MTGEAQVECMQCMVPTVYTEQNFGSSVEETAPSNLNSQELPIELTLTRLEPGNKRDDAKQKGHSWPRNEDGDFPLRQLKAVVSSNVFARES